MCAGPVLVQAKPKRPIARRGAAAERVLAFTVLTGYGVLADLLYSNHKRRASGLIVPGLFLRSCLSRRMKGIQMRYARIYPIPILLKIVRQVMEKEVGCNHLRNESKPSLDDSKAPLRINQPEAGEKREDKSVTETTE
jgi:hypothetical protein